jgi:hypothetical protein
MSRAAQTAWAACASALADCVLIGGTVWLLLSGLSKAHESPSSRECFRPIA